MSDDDLPLEACWNYRESAGEVLVMACGVLIGDGATLDELPATVSGTMPCGAEFSYTRDSIPRESTPCPCGDSREWLVKWVTPKGGGAIGLDWWLR